MPGPLSSRPHEEWSFLDLYLKYTEKQESPEIFHLWVGYTLIGAVLGKKCFFDKGFYKLYPNLFTVLVAGTAWMRKSTAVDMGVGFLDNVKSLLVINGRITPEKFLQKLAENQEYHPELLQSQCKPCLIHADELSVFLTRQSYGDPMIGILTRLFSCPSTFSNETKHGRSDYLRDPYVCIIACTTPRTIARSIPPAALEEGFGNRVMWIYQDVSDRENALPILSPDEESAKIVLARKLEEIARVSGEFTLTTEAAAWYETWYHEFRGSLPPDPRVKEMYSRKHDHLLRLSMILSGSVHSRTMDKDICGASLMSLEAMEALAPAAFSEIGSNEDSLRVDRLKGIMQRIGQGTHSHIMLRMQPCTASEFREALETAFESGWLKREGSDGRIYTYVRIVDK